MPGQKGSYHNSSRRAVRRLHPPPKAACGKTTREQLSNFETTAVCKLHTDVAVAKVNIQFQQISFSPTLLLVAAGCSLRAARGSGCMLLPPSSLGTNVCTTFVAQETMRPSHRAALLRATHDAACWGWAAAAAAIQVGKYYKVERNEESATILCFTVPWFFCIFTTHVPPTQTKQADIHPVHTLSTGQGQRIVSCYCYNKGEPDCLMCFICCISLGCLIKASHLDSGWSHFWVLCLRKHFMILALIS